MLVGARSFGQGPTRSSQAPPSRHTEKSLDDTRLDRSTPRAGFRGFGWRPIGFRPESISNEKTKSHLVSATSTNRSRLSNERPAPTSPRPITPRKSKESMRNRHRHNGSHDPHAMDPSMAALLAVTSIPRRRRFEPSRKARSLPRQMSLAELREEWMSMDAIGESLASTSPTMDILLSPPESRHDGFDLGRRLRRRGNAEEDDEDDEDDDDAESPWLPSRSTSSDSVPSLIQDDTSMPSWKSSFGPHSPVQRRLAPAKPERLPSSPQSVDSILDHPLIHVEEDDMLDFSLGSNEIREPKSHRPGFVSSQSIDSATDSPSKRPNPSASTFRSNLTASLQALRRVASSLSNFAAPSTLPDDHVSRGLLGPGVKPTWPSEKRPRQMNGVPTAQLRRYLNPPQHGLPIRQVAHDFHLHNSHVDHIDLEAAAHPFNGMTPEEAEVFPQGSVIPLQDYNRSEARRGRGRGGRMSLGSEAGRVGQLQQQQQRREPRENSEFLRICVLELNMRRQGKMEGPLGVGLGRKAWWLPPREFGASGIRAEGAGEDRTTGGVPRRWQGISANYD